jgi:LCP family protein required for cell wall assembly
MPSRDDRQRGIIIPFPAEAIRRPPAPAFVTRPIRPPRVSAHGRIVLARIALGTLVAGAVAGAVFMGAAALGARRSLARPGRAQSAVLRSSVPGSVNLLIAGLEADVAARNERGALSDAVMLLHLDADRERAWLVSIPRDAWVSLPGHGDDRIDVAYALGGPRLLVGALERLSRLRIDHLAVIDHMGIRQLTDGVGGVAVSLDPPRTAGPDARRGGLALEMSGAMALEYVSERHGLADGDVDHIRREHRYLRALLAQLRERGTLADPPALRDLAAALGTSMRVDAGLTPAALRSLLDSTRQLRIEDVTFLTAPVPRATWPGGAAAVQPDEAGCSQLWDALAHDEMAAFVDAHPDLVSPAPSR